MDPRPPVLRKALKGPSEVVRDRVEQAIETISQRQLRKAGGIGPCRPPERKQWRT